MPIFEITSPDGKVYHVDAPDGATEEQAISYLQQESSNIETPKNGHDLGRTSAVVQGFNSALPFGNRISAGLGALGAAAVAGDSDVSSLYNEARANQKATSAEHPDYELAGTVGGIVNSLPLALGKTVANTPVLGGAANAVSKATTATGDFIRGGSSLLSRAGRSAVVAAPSSAIYNYGASENDLDSKEALADAGRGAVVGGAVAGALPVVGAAAGAALGAVTPKISEGLLDVASIARRHDIPLSLDQVTGSRSLKTAQKVSQDLPFSGQQGFREKQMTALNRALFRTVGVEADRFTPQTMAKAFDKVGSEFDNVTKGRSFSIGGDFVDNLAKTAEEVRSQYGEEAFNTFQREAGNVINDFSGDNISGELISRQRGRINAMARKATPGQKEALLDLENNIVDGITGGDEATQKALSQAKQRYKNLIVLEPIAQKAKGGMISPSLLNNRVAQVYKRAHTVGNSGDIGDLARVGSELLPELGGSDTMQKAAYMGALSPAGYVAPLTTATTLAGNRVLQSGFNRNQGVIDKAIMKEIMNLPPAEARAALQKLKNKPEIKAALEAEFQQRKLK